MFLIVLISLLALLIFALISFQSKIIFFPEVLSKDYKYHFPGNYQEIFYTTNDGEEINALHFTVDEPKGIVFYSHGNAGSLRTWGYVADDFNMHGYDLLIYDYRSYGKSSGKITEENLYQDAEMIYMALKTKYDERNIIVFGRSIGTGIASKIASAHNPKLLILESPYYNLTDLAKKIFPFLPSSIVNYKFRNDLHIQQASCPIVIFHGTMDEVIYFESSKKLEKSFGPHDKLISIPGGHHNDLSEFPMYQNELRKLLE